MKGAGFSGIYILIMEVLKSILIWFTGITVMVVFFPVIFIIWLLVLPFDRNRTIVHWLLVYKSLIISYLIPVWKIKIEGREKAVKGQTYVIISNHQSILDILLLNCLRYRFKWISKIENMKVPVLGWYLRMAGYITIDRGNRESRDKMMAEALDCLGKAISIMIFPEGTRSPDGETGFFKRGAFELAISAQTAVLPVLIAGTRDILPKHGLRFGGRKRVMIRVLDPVPPESFGTDDCDELAEKFRKHMLEAFEETRKESIKQ
jgi:1-acyl-sn-glycerol-3-phosphate acyltransferase